MSFRVAKVHRDAVIPTRATEGSAGFDLTSVESVLIPAISWRAIAIGLAISVPSDSYARIAPRSGQSM